MAGLDSFAALNVMDHLSQLAAMGHTIIASIHQPREGIWNMFHKVRSPTLRLRQGSTLYYGYWILILYLVMLHYRLAGGGVVRGQSTLLWRSRSGHLLVPRRVGLPIYR